MSYSVDVLNSTLQEVRRGWQDLFTINHPLLDRMGYNQHKLDGRYFEFPVLTGGPGQGLTLRTGNEPIVSQRTNNLRKGSEDAAYVMYHFVVPNKDVMDADHAQDYADLVDNYAEPALAECLELFVEQVVRGASTNSDSDFGGGFDGLVTLNGNSTYNPQGTSKTGIFQFAAQASQTGTVHGLPLHSAASDATTGWYNQYTTISSFSQGGRLALRTIRDRANQQGGKLQGGIDLLLSDNASYQNYAESLDNQIVASVVENDKGQGKIREGLKFGQSVWFAEPYIDLTKTGSFNATQQTGVTYGFCTDDWGLMARHKASSKDFFQVSDGIPLPNQDMIQYRVWSYMNPYCMNLRRQFCATGTATH